jgi:hypothetical protein
VASWALTCGSCHLSWHRVGNFSEHERGAIESRPCPRCGAYTLGCRESKPAARKRTLACHRAVSTARRVA